MNPRIGRTLVVPQVVPPSGGNVAKERRAGVLGIPVSGRSNGSSGAKGGGDIFILQP